MNITISWLGLLAILVILLLLGWRAYRHFKPVYLVIMGTLIIAVWVYLAWYLWHYATLLR